MSKNLSVKVSVVSKPPRHDKGKNQCLQDVFDENASDLVPARFPMVYARFDSKVLS